MTKKISHDYICDECDSPAIGNTQDSWQEYRITNGGDFIKVDEWEGNTNEFFCDKHRPKD